MFYLHLYIKSILFFAYRKSNSLKNNLFALVSGCKYPLFQCPEFFVSCFMRTFASPKTKYGAIY